MNHAISKKIWGLDYTMCVINTKEQTVINSIKTMYLKKKICKLNAVF